MFTFLVPASVREWFTSNVQARAERLFALADRQLDQLEAEIAERQSFAGITAPVNRIVDVPNGKRSKASL